MTELQHHLREMSIDGDADTATADALREAIENELESTEERGSK